MSTAAFLFVITLVTTLIQSISGSFQRCITCPCGSSNRNYTHCINELILRKLTCERWSNCQTCKANTTFCISCRPGNFGPTCSENENARRKRQDDPDLLIHARYPRQSGSDRHSQARCLNHGPIPHGRVLVIPPFDDSQNDDDFDFPYGTILKFICDDGFVLDGQDTSRCSSKSYWTEDIPKCVRETTTPQESCRHPGVDVNGRINNPLINSQRRRQVFPAGTELTFVCNEGFEPEGATVLACLNNGQWTSLPPKCRRNSSEEVVELPCRHPGVVVNSMFNKDLYQVSSFPVGTAVTFRCIGGTRRKGPMTIICQSNGKWSEPPPTCEPARYRKR